MRLLVTTSQRATSVFSSATDLQQIACVSKICGGSLAVYFMGESRHDALCLGILMNIRGLVELIVLNIGLDLGILSPTMFAMLVMMALVTTMITSPLLPLLGYKQRLSQDREEEIHDRYSIQKNISS
jgi:Kef-type K+ transport system membrane component KefB